MLSGIFSMTGTRKYYSVFPSFVYGFGTSGKKIAYFPLDSAAPALKIVNFSQQNRF